MWFRTKDKWNLHRRVWISWPPKGPSASQAMLCHIIITQGNCSTFVEYCQSSYGVKTCRRSEKQHAHNYDSTSRYSWLWHRAVWSIRNNNSEKRWFKYTWYARVDCVWNVMAHAYKTDFVFRRNGRVHLNGLGCQFSRLLAAEVCASAVVMLDTPCSEAVWRVLATYSIRQFLLQFPSRASPCDITFQLDSTSWFLFTTYGVKPKI